MPLNPRRLRLWFALAIAMLVLIVAGFYLRGYYTRYLVARAIKHKIEKLGIDVQQSADQFSLSKSEGGRTLFTVHAAKAIQVTSGRAELHDVNIVVYGNSGNRFDQIYGKSFEYDPKSGIVRAEGEVHIDLQGVAPGEAARPELGPPKELQNPIHLKTSGLEFNRNTGMATTSERIEFRVPQASGSAIGGMLDSKSNRLTLHSDVQLQQSGEHGASLRAANAVIEKDPPSIQFNSAHITRETSNLNTSNLDTEHLTVYLRDDNSIEKAVAAGNVTATAHGKNDARVQAPRGELRVDENNRLRSATLSGGVNFESHGDQPAHGTAGRVVLDFNSANRVEKIHALDNVHLIEDAAKNRPQSQAMVLTAQAVDLTVLGERKAETIGPAQIVMTSVATPANSAGGETTKAGADSGPFQLQERTGHPATTTTTATAGRFLASFDAKGHLRTLVGSPNAKVVSSTPGQPDKITTSNVLTLTMNPAGGLAGIVQDGDFRFTEAAAKPAELGSQATAAKATYDPQTGMFTLTGNPSVSDAGANTTSDHMRVNRTTGDAFADGSVKTTYSQIEAQPNGALLATSDPIHVTAASMIAHRNGGTARYSGGARLWQGANIIEAPSIDFDRDKRTVVAQGKPGQPVSTVFVQPAQNGNQKGNRAQTPVNVTGSRLTYHDSDRQAHFDGGVVLRGADGTVTADHVTVFLVPRGENAGNTVEKAASQLEKIVAEGHIVIQQQDRRGTGDKLVYLAKDGSFTLTGGPPSIFDAEHGQVTGVSLTFFSHDDRVLVEGGGKSAPSVTKARVIK